MSPITGFALASLAHAGFQVAVTALVYPALVRSGRVHPDDWAEVHGRHSRAIGPVVAVLYGALLATGVWVLATGVGSVAAAVAGVGAVGAALVTAVAAAPTHGRLSRPDPVLLHRLVVADRVRCGWAVLGAVGAVVAVC